jgi:hypothetical protein
LLRKFYPLNWALCLQGILVPIYVKDEQSNEKIAHLAKEHWELPVQIKELENWLFEETRAKEDTHF